MRQTFPEKNGDRRGRRDFRGSVFFGGPRERDFNRFRGNNRGGRFGGPRENLFDDFRGDDGFRGRGFRGGGGRGAFRGREFGEFRGGGREEDDIDNRRLFESLTDPTEVPKVGNFFEVRVCIICDSPW